MDSMPVYQRRLCYNYLLLQGTIENGREDWTKPTRKKSLKVPGGCSRTMAWSQPNLYPISAACISQHKLGSQVRSRGKYLLTLYANQKSSAMQAVSQVTLSSTAPLIRIQDPCIQPNRGRRNSFTGSWKRPKSSAILMISAADRKFVVQWFTSL